MERFPDLDLNVTIILSYFFNNRIAKKTIKSGTKDSANKEKIDSSHIRNLSITNGVIFTNVSGTALTKAKEFCEKFGFTYLEDELANVPYIEMLVYQGVPANSTQAANQQAQLPKNYKIAYAMLKEKAIIKQEWVEDSLEKGEVQDVEQYKFKYNIEPRKSNLKSISNTNFLGLYPKMKFYVDPEFESQSNSNISKSELEALVSETGGSVSDYLLILSNNKYRFLTM